MSSLHKLQQGIAPQDGVKTKTLTQKPVSFPANVNKEATFPYFFSFYLTMLILGSILFIKHQFKRLFKRS